MNNIKQQIISIFFVNNKFVSGRVAMHTQLKQQVIDLTSFIENDEKFTARLYCILNDITSRPVCTCGKKTKYRSFTEGYSKFCGSKCANLDPSVRGKIEATCMEKYGGIAPASSSAVRNKMEKTTLSRFGVTNAYKLSEVKAKIKEVVLGRFGVDNVANSQEVIERKKATCLEKYDSETPLHSAEIQGKIKQSNLNKYGNINAAAAGTVVRQKIEQTNTEKYGGKSPFCSDKIRDRIIEEHGNPFSRKEVKEKIKQHYISKYGVSTASQKHLSPDIIQKLEDVDWLKHQHHTLQKPIYIIAKEICVSESTVNFRMHRAGIEVIIYGSSAQEKEIQEFLCQENIAANTRSVIPPYELDIYLPDRNLAIEFNGLYWHSYNSLQEEDKFKHLKKTKMCLEKGIQLLHIFENEWINKQEVWKSIINHKLGKNKSIFARKCVIKEVSSRESMEFLNTNHLQGNCPARIKLGLYYENELVCLMSFSTPRFNANYEWELIRFCNKINTNVVGGASRLFQSFIKTYNPSSIISYSDARYSNGQLYEKLGMRYASISDPNYFYVNLPDIRLHSRMKFQKHKQQSLLENFDSSLSEAQNMFNHGYRRIWDCGNMVFVWSR